jgi:steroid delta-isomerase-like uncharacterized protein
MGKWPSNLVAAFSAHDLDATLSYFTDDIFYEEVVADGVVAHGKQELRARIQGIFDSFPDINLELIAHFSSGEHDCVEWISSGTHMAGSSGLPAAGKCFSYREAVVTERRDGKISRFSLYCDMMTFMRQLGLLPATAQQ